MNDINQLLKLSARFEKRKSMLDKARAVLSMSQTAYQRHLKFAEQAYHEDVILHSVDGWRRGPLVTCASQKKAEENSERALAVSNRLYRYHETLLTSLFISDKNVEDFY